MTNNNNERLRMYIHQIPYILNYVYEFAMFE